MSNQEVYVIFSKSQFEAFKKMYKKTGNNYEPKYVIVQGTKKQYTQIVSDMNKVIYSDSIIVTKGNKSEIKFI